MFDIKASEYGLVSSSVLIVVGYHLYLRGRIQRSPLTTAFGLTNYLRRAWVEMIMQDKRDILAVQTLRNWIMTASFLASTAILIDLATLNLLFRVDSAIKYSSALNFVGSRHEALLLVKVLLVTLDFFFAFFSFSLAIRYYNHVNFMINISADRENLVTVDSVAQALNLATTHYTLGMRAYYLAVPLTLWLFGPILMFIGTVILTGVLHKLDHTV